MSLFGKMNRLVSMGGLSLFLCLVSCDNPLQSVSVEQYSVYLSGSEYIEVPYSPSLDSLNSGQFSIELFVQPDSITGQDSPALFMVSNDSGGNEIGLYRNFARDDMLMTYMGDRPVPGVNNVPIPGFQFTDGQWHFIAITYDSGAVTLYIDGQRLLTGQLPDSTRLHISHRSLLIGADYDGTTVGNHWNGLIDEVRLWNTVLTGEEIRFHMENPDQLSKNYDRTRRPQDLLLGLWRFNEGSGQAVTDASDYENHGTIVRHHSGIWRATGMAN